MSFLCDIDQAQINCACTVRTTYSMLLHEKPEQKYFATACPFATISPQFTYTSSQAQNCILWFYHFLIIYVLYIGHNLLILKEK